MRNIISLLTLALALSLAVRSALAQAPPSASTPSPPVLQGVSNTGANVSPTPFGKELPQEIGEDEPLRVNTTLVSIPVSVMDGSGKYVTDLKQGDFRVYEDGVEQRIAVFSEISQPTFVVLLLDVSTSVAPRLRQIQDAAIAFTDQLQTSDYVYPVAFSGRVIPLLAQATNDRNALREAIRRTRPVNDGATSVYDAVQTVSDEILKRFHGRKALILFTDGEDVSSRAATKKGTLHDAQELDALVYTVQYPRNIYLVGPYSRTTLTVMSPGHKAYLRKLAENTGGRYFKGDKSEKIREAFTSIAEELRQQYIIGYYPDKPVQSGQSRRVRIIISRPTMRARTRKTLINIR
jgi:Ca-activated chloride channel homolog